MRSKTRDRHVTITGELVELFRKALPGKQTWWDEHISGKDTLTLEERLQAYAAIRAFNSAAGVRPWERSPLDPGAGGPIQAALLAKLTGAELGAWQAHVRKVQRYLDREGAKSAREYEARVKAAQ